jgi:hypothetical protein
MLGRHVYRVAPLAAGGWSVRKDGEATALGSRPTREDASGYAFELAAVDEPSKVIVEDERGAIAAERSFGDDTVSALEAAAEGRKPTPKSERR